MRQLYLILAVACGAPQPAVVSAPAPAGPAVTDPTPAPPSYAYPPARQATTTETLHGEAVADPYRWLEDPDAPETRTWIDAQNRLTEGVLAKLGEREGLRKDLARAWNFPRHTPPVHEGGRWFYRKNNGLQNQAVLYVADTLDGPARVLLDPNALAADGTVALHIWKPSRDGKLLAYGLQTAGSDWVEIRVRDVANGQDLPDHLRWAKFTQLDWDPSHKGFYYSRYDAPKPGEELRGTNFFQKLCYHAIGTPQDQDRVVFERPDKKDWGFGGSVTEDGKWLVVLTWLGAENKNAVFVRALPEPKPVKGKPAPFLEVIGTFEHEWAPIANDGPLFWFRTDWQAPRGQVVQLDVRKPSERKTVIAQGPDTLDVAAAVGHRLVAHRMHDAHSTLTVHKLDGALEREIALPGLGSAENLTGRRDEPLLFFTFASFVQPASVLRYDTANGQTAAWQQPDLGLKAEEWVTEQVFAPSKDGTKVPVFVAHRKDVTPDGARPVWLFGYGGFSVTMTPFFSPQNLVWMQRGGVFAMAVLRGGAEYGEEWHLAGKKANKQNVFDDFQAAAEHLVKLGWTQPKRIAIAGGSNGGLLVGACLTQRPELFGAALPAVGVMDMLRFHKFTIGWAWVPEYGSADSASDFAVLRKYSPLHNLKPGARYPATLVTTGDHDDRVVPGHSFKFTAALQAAQAQAGADAPPALIRIDVKAGHGAGKPTAKLIEEAADRLAFARWALGVAKE